MVATTSLFSQVLSLVDRDNFHQCVSNRDAEKASKGFRSWDQFVAMLFCQLGAADSLREICGGLATALGKLSHLGLKEAPKRSTLAYANEHRSWELFRDVFYQLYSQCSKLAATRNKKFRFKNPLKSIDSSTIELCVKTFDWAKFRRTKGAVKLHLMLDHQGCLPAWALITDGKTHDVKAARIMRFAPGTIVAMDRGYNDYSLFYHWTLAGIFFVTRMKGNAAFEVVRSLPVPDGTNIVSDEIIRWTGSNASKKCPVELRRVVAYDPEQDRTLEFVTNIERLAASTIAAIYKDRWQIELFFKAIKQNLKIKTFVGTTENAVQIQIWTALISMLLLKFLQMKSKFGWSLSNLAAMLRFNLLTYRDLSTWLNDPFGSPAMFPPDDMPLFAWLGST